MSKRTKAEKRAHRQRAAEKHWSCDRKIGYRTVEEAQAAIATTPKSAYQPLHVYRCNFCPKFHVGHPSSEVSRAACD